ncbi:hypothetical protein [Sphingosinicella sp. CPCC 101087]|uniref:hypothetical protein n=1 Tax=Sphingosinicella sp. CPCC 101087 TaxID=2497754 RepID=UPI00101BBE45|nr:hypothetical protein [Sphingosinicella sp. CPCC 101087]
MNSRIAIAVAAVLLVAGGAALWALYRPFSPGAEAPVQVIQPPAGAPAAPDPAQAVRIVRVECRQGTCQWARVVSVTPLAAAEDGELRRLTYRPGSSMDDGSDPAADGGSGIDWEASDRQDYAFCSTARPAFAFPDPSAGGDSALLVHRLDLFNLAGYQSGSAILYALTCHDLAMDGANGPAFHDLGYRPGTPNDQTRAASPEDLLRL